MEIGEGDGLVVRTLQSNAGRLLHMLVAGGGVCASVSELDFFRVT